MEKDLKLSFDKNFEYLINLDKTKDLDAIGFFTNDYLKMAALYWGISALNLIHKIDEYNKEDTIKFIQQCQQENGGFGGSIGHDSHMTSTHYAILILLQYDSLDSIKIDKVAEYVSSLQQDDGSFKADVLGETDTRFSYCAVAILKLIGKLTKDYINLEKATEYVLSCQNFDGGFGGIPGAESHAAYTFCCVAFLSVTDQLNLIKRDFTGQWLAARQTHKGGFNGRPEKLADVCYSWWVLSSLYMIERDSFIDKALLINFILTCQDGDGGFADRPGNGPDVFHTFFAMSGLSLMGYEGLLPINATYAIPDHIVKKYIN
jgi:geranylgeranyl transferase type-2 subunit beta